ncbi:MAG: hypothetical protein AAB428_02280 [Patescibacteria group bacterium]
MPRWHGLSWRPGEPAIVVSVHREALATASKFPPDSMARHVAKSLGLGQFEGSYEKSFGFDGALTRIENGDFVEFVARLPVVYHVLDQDCQECKGTAKNEYEDECHYCMGLGKKSECRWEEAFAVSASLSFLLMSLERLEWSVPSSRRQLMTMLLSVQSGSDGCAFSGMFGIPLVRWLSEMPIGRPIPEMTEAMKRAYYHMFTRRKWDHGARFEAYVNSRDGWLNISCPGQGCGINPKLEYMTSIRGYEIHSHNVDSPVHQLTLLAGLAALHDRADKEMK